ncbi:MAG: SPFH domain-containing protein [Planctomycetota bacterium]|nr:SPFH domain-containing protein [Planctomycetota bacterium]
MPPFEVILVLFIAVVFLPLGLWMVKEIIGIQYIANDRVGVVEKLWGGSIKDGRIIALDNEAGFQCDIKRGGLHFGLPRWKYRIHRVPLVTISQGEIGYVYARDGDSLSPMQTLARFVFCDNFQNARGFLIGANAVSGKLSNRGQRGRQRAILREGVYAINLALFVVITKGRVYGLRASREEEVQYAIWQKELADIRAYAPIVIGGAHDDIGIVTVQDGPPLPTGEIIAPEAKGHSNFQDPETFLANDGFRGKQYAVLTDGTYFINRWFATVESVPKIVVPIGSVGVVISYYGKKGTDISGSAFRHGERVAQGERGVWDQALPPGKYAFNTYAGVIVQVPTTNFVLHWITGRSESHHYDDNLKSIDLVTRDAYEPELPLSLVVHIDYQKAPGVIQRFGDVKRLITQTIDPMLSAYFRDVSHKRSMLELLQSRDEIQAEARKNLRERFTEFDIECVDVLIGKPESGPNDGGKIETLLEQLRQRQLSVEQVQTFEQQRIAADKRRTLEEATAVANKQKDLTNSSVDIRIVENQANAQLAKAEMGKKQTIVEAEAALEQARRQAEQTVVKAEAEGKRMVIAAKAQSEQEQLLGKGEGIKALQVGLAQAEALRKQVMAYGDPRLYALVMASQALSKSEQPLVPERVFVTGGGANGDGKAGGGADNPLQTLLNLLLAKETAFAAKNAEEGSQMQAMSDRVVKDLMDGMAGVVSATPAAPPPAAPKK